MIAIVGVAVAGATGAFFSDTETSTGNTFSAGAIDLLIDNSSYYNGEVSEGTSWYQPVNLEDGVHFFFNFGDLKPGDWGEDTISLHIDNNPAWLCSNFTLTSNDDVSSIEPELGDGDDEDVPDDLWDGELAQAITFIWWADDGDNVLEDDEDVISEGPLGSAPQNVPVVVTLADSTNNIWNGEANSPLIATGTPRYIGKAWCFGEITLNKVTQDESGDQINPTGEQGPGFTCNGAGLDNRTQTDTVTADISFYAVQSRNNGDFVCGEISQPEPPTEV